MAEEKSQQEKTEQATPKRRQDARKKGDVPRSRELTMTGVMVSGAAAITLLAAPMGGNLLTAMRDALAIDRSRIFDTTQMTVAFSEFAADVFLGLAPLAIVLLAAVFLSAMLIGGWSFSMKAAAPKFERLDAIKGIKRVFSAKALHELLKALAKFTVVAVIAIAWLWFLVDELSGLGREPVQSGIAHALKICGQSLIIVCSGLILIAVFDVPFQLWQYQKKLKMTRQEVKEEFKDTEGRPEVKSKIRTLQQQVAQRRMMEDIPIASVVITNPTHYAVALKYDDTTMGAPQVVAKGKDLLAKRIREVATEHGVPLFSAPPLARALFRSTELGDEIPAKLYSAVAQVLAYIFQLNETLKPGQRPMPKPVPEVNEDDFPDPMNRK